MAYNKMDVPDSSDYWPDIRQSLEAAGVAPDLMCPISAVTGQGVLDLITMVHTALDELPSEVTICCMVSQLSVASIHVFSVGICSFLCVMSVCLSVYQGLFLAVEMCPCNREKQMF